MTDIIKTAGGETLARKPWKAPRLIDLDDLDQTRCFNPRRGQILIMGNKFRRENIEYSNFGDCYFHGPEQRSIS